MRKRGVIEGVGLVDVDYKTQIFEGKGSDRKRVWICPFYSKWRDLVRRCYSKKWQDKNPTYKDCTVCEKWLYFSNFKVWMQQQEWEGKEIDKDLLNAGNKEYSPDTCIFITSMVNCFIITSNKIRGLYPLGVSFHKASGKFQAACKNPTTNKPEHLGLYLCPYKAHEAWKEKKLEWAVYLGSLPENININKLLIDKYTFKEGEICQY